MTTTATTTPPTKPPLGKMIIRRVAIAAVLLLLMLVPSAVLFIITKQPAATYASMGAIIGAFALLAGGRRIAVITAVVLSLLAPISIVAGLSPFAGAALMAIMTLTVGRLSIFGLHRATMMVPIFMGWLLLTPIPWIPNGDLNSVNDLLTKHGLNLAEALNEMHNGAASASSASSGSSGASSTVTTFLQHQRFDNSYLMWVSLFFFIGTIIPVIVLPLAMRKMKKPELAPHPRSEAVPYTIIITVLAAAATYYCLDHPKLVGGSFLIATILVLTQIGNEIAWKLTIQRVLGTFGGVVLLIGITKVVGTVSYSSVLGVPMPMGYYGIGLLFGAFAIIAKFSPRQWIYYILITPTAALLNAFTAAQATSFGDQRLVDNAVGAVLVIAATVVTLVAGRLMKGRVTIAPALNVPDASPA